VGSFLAALLPSAGVLFLFIVVMRAMLHADRRERRAQAALEARERLATANDDPPRPPSAPGEDAQS
jgi:cbb3-type cytochrome oxidase subunit 3